MINKLSLRMKITLMTTSIIVVVAIILTLVSMGNANRSLDTTMSSVQSAQPLQRNMESSSAELDFTTTDASNVTTSEESITDNFNLEVHSIISSVKTSFNHNAIIIMFVVIIVCGGFTYYIIGNMLKPVTNLSETMEAINENQLSHRITQFTAGDELNKLADSFNIMIDRLDKAFEDQKRFSADAAHELKTPLAVLKTNLDVLSMDENPTIDDYSYTIDIFKKQTNRMIDLVDNLFLISAKKEYGLDDEIILDNIFSEVLNDLKNDIAKKNIKVEINNSNLSILGNKVMLTHALGNIVQNAVKYNKQDGSINIHIKDEGNVVITIKDNGIGIPEETVPYIFEPFYRVDSSRSRKIGGAGLGLAISNKVITNHKGKITYSNNPEGGSIFKISLPKS